MEITHGATLTSCRYGSSYVGGCPAIARAIHRWVVRPDARTAASTFPFEDAWRTCRAGQSSVRTASGAAIVERLTRSRNDVVCDGGTAERATAQQG
jgi:hypothetical protein